MPYVNVNTGSLLHYTSSFSVPGGSNVLLNYYSANHLYYSLFNTGSGTITESGSFDNYLETSFFTGSRYFSGSGLIYSIPKNLYGTHIEPGTVTVGSGRYEMIDDGEGNLLSSGSIVGNIIYSHGMIVVNDNNYYNHYIDNPEADIYFKSNVPVHTLNMNLKVSEYEFNHTLNPTAQSGSTVLEYSGSRYLQPSGVYRNSLTGSEFQPYITTVGLYNDSNELVAIGKLAQPLPKPADTELTIQVKLDI